MKTSPGFHGVVILKYIFCERLSAKFIKNSIVNFDTKLSDLRQTFNEFINVYYTRLTVLMPRIKVRDRIYTRFSLSFLKSVILNVVMKSCGAIY